MVGVAQLVEPRVVIPVVVGSSPIVHPNLNTTGIYCLVIPVGLTVQVWSAADSDRSDWLGFESHRPPQFPIL